MPTPVAGTAAVRFVADTSGLNAEIAKAVNPLAKSFGGKFSKALGPVLEQQKKHLDTFTTAAKYASLGAAGLAGYGLYSVVKAGAAFEKQMSVNSAVSEANGKQMVALEKQSIKLGQATFYSAKQAAEAQGELIKGGLAVKQVIGGGLPAALALAEAGQLDLADAATTTVNVMKLFGLGGKEAMSVADMLATAANRTTADVGDFAEALKYGGSVSKLAGYSLNETVTVLEALAEAGIKGSMAGTTFKTATIQLLKPTKKQAELQKELGLELLTGNGHLKDAAGLSEELRRATEGMTKAERTKTLATLGGQRGVIGLNAVMERSPRVLRELEKANAKQGTAQEIAKKKMDNLAGAWEQFKGSLETAEIQIYKGIAPALKTLSEEGERVVNRIGSIFSNENLSGSEKFQRALGVVGDELGKLWDEAEIPKHAAEAFAAAAPVVAKAAGETALLAAKEFGKAFIHAPFIAKVAMGAWAINFIGGKSAFVGIGKMYGKQFGATFASQAVETSVAAAIPEKIAAESMAASSVPMLATPRAARVSSFVGPGTGAARKAASEGAMLNSAFDTMSATDLGIPDLSKELAVEGDASGKSFVRSMGSSIRTGAPALASSVASVGGRLIQGAATWGIGGFVVGQTVKELGDDKTATTIGDALQGAGIGAAVGSVIPGVGTALGAAAGGAGGALVSLFGSNHEAQERGEKYGEEFLKGWQKNAPLVEKMAQNGFIGTPTRKKQLGTDIAQHGGRTDSAYAYYSGSGLKGERSTLEDRLDNTKLSKGQSSAIEAEIQAIDKAIGSIKKDRLEFKGVLSRMSGDALFGIGEINKDLKTGLSTADSAWGKGTKPWRQHTVEAMREAQQAIKEGMDAGVINTETGQKKINALLRKINLTSGKDPAHIAEGIEKSFREAGKVTSSGTKELIRDLGEMPKGAKAQGIKAIEEMTTAWAAGHPKLEKQVGLLTKNIESEFKGASKIAAQSQQHAMQQIIEANTGASSSVAEALTSIGGNLTAALKALGAKNLVEFKITQEASAFHHRQGGGPIPGTFMVPGTGSGDTFKTALPPGSFIENRNAARMPFQEGGLTPVALEPKERVWLPQAVKSVGAGYLHARNAAMPRFQKGGETGTSIPHPMLSGPEPLRSGAQHGVDQTWKAAEKYLAAHSEPQRVLAMLKFAEAQASKGYPYVFGGGHGSFSGPYDCSGFVSAILHAGGFLDSPLSVQQGSGLYTLGAAGPGKDFTWGVRGTSGANAHTMMSVKKPAGKGWGFFESGGSGGGAHEDSGWDGSFSFRHMPGFQRGGQLGMPPKAQEAVAKFGQEAFNPKSKHFVGWGYQKGGQVEGESPKTSAALGRIWGRAAGLYRRSGASPYPQGDYEARGLTGTEGDVGKVESGPGGKRVFFDRGWMGRVLGGDRYAQESLLHEWAHVFQKGGLSRWEREGGATEFARWAGPRVFGISPKGLPYPQGYQGFAEAVKSKLGQKWITKGQFGFQRGGTVPRLHFSTGGPVPPKDGEIVGASTYGGPADTVSNPTYGAWGASHPFAGHKAFAELAMGKALGGLSFGTQMEISRAGKSVVAEKMDIGLGGGSVSGKNRAIDLHYETGVALGVLGSGSSAWLGTVRVAPVGAHENAKEEKDHTYKEDVPANYGGVLCGNKPNFNMPKNLSAVEHEIDHWQKMLGRYKSAITKARKENKPHIVQELQHREAEIASFLRELRNEKVKLRQEKAHKSFTKRIQRKFGNLFGRETAIEEAQHAYEKRNQFAEQVVDLEPLQPELPGEPEFPEQAPGESDTVYEGKRRDAHNAYEVSREGIEKAYNERYSGYVEGQERPAFQHVLDSEAGWRNTILGAEQFAAGDWQKQNFLGGFEGRFEDHVVHNVEKQELVKARIQQYTEEIQALKQKVAEWRHDPANNGKPEPKWIKTLEGEWATDEGKREDLSHVKLPNLRFKESELRKTIGEARELFYPGKAEGGHKGFELTTNPVAPAIGSGSFEEALKDVQGYYWPNLHEMIGTLPQTPSAGMFGGAIWDTQTAWSELGLKVSQAASSIQKAQIEGPGTGGDDTSAADSERTQLLEELLQQDNQEKIGRRIEEQTFGEVILPPYAGKAHTGAVVPGPPSQEKTMIVKGREGIFTQEQMAALAPMTGTSTPDVTVRVHGDIHSDRVDPIEVLLGDRRLDAKIEQVQATGSRRGARRAARGLAVSR
jgi:TP901 family phage tail tape measure protein